MRIQVIGVDHRTAPLAALATLSDGEGLSRVLMARQADVAGAVLLSTCNRFELICDTDDSLGPERLRERVCELLRELAPDVDERALSGLRADVGDDAVQHVFEVAAGMRAAVIGDKQVAGQLRRAYELASERGQCTGRLHRLCHDALTSSRAVASRTSLGAAGRSVAGVGLDMTGLPGGLRGRRVLLVGTGAFARVVLAELGTRRAGRISCWSASGRAERFAAHHDVVPLDDDGLAGAVAEAELVVTCSGNGAVLDAGPLLAGRPELAAPGAFPVLDLSLGGDLTEEARALPGVRVIGLEEVRDRADETQREVIEQAQQVVDEGVARHLAKERSRGADPAIAAMRAEVGVLVDREIARVRARESEEVCAAVERSLRHLAGVMLHTPTVRGNQLAEEGRGEEFFAALDTLLGIEVDR